MNTDVSPPDPESATFSSAGNLSAAQKLRAVLQLMRLPTVFTALSNIFCGYFITQPLTVREVPGRTELWLLLMSTFGLYLGGMVLNDVFDTTVDARERPERPIPSGRISRTAAAWLGVTLMLFGVAAAAAVGMPSLLVACGIVPAVLVYNAWLKSTMAAPLGMATCRFLNLLLGASVMADLNEFGAARVLGTAAGLGLYVLGVTQFARNEAGQSTPQGLLSGVCVLLCGIGLDAWIVSQHGASSGSVSGGRMALLLLALNLTMRSALAISRPHPRLIQKTVGLMLLWIIFLDGIMVFSLTADAKLAALIILLVAPAMLLRRAIPMS